MDFLAFLTGFFMGFMVSSKRSVSLSESLPETKAAIVSGKSFPIFRAIIFDMLEAPCWLQLFPPFIRLAKILTFR